MHLQKEDRTTQLSRDQPLQLVDFQYVRRSVVGISRFKLYKLIEEGVIRGRELGDKYYFNKEEVDDDLRHLLARR
jgi:excisionase family DNA binding protein